MNQVAKIEKSSSAGRIYNLPLESWSGELLSYEPPCTETEWHALPERFLDGLIFASRFAGREKTYVDYLQVLGSKVYATDNITLVEYDMGAETAPYLSHTAMQVAKIKAFGDCPTHASADAERQHLKWANGNHLAFALENLTYPNKVEEFDALFDAEEWNNFQKVDAGWRDQIIGHFSFKPMRDNDGLMYFTPDRIVGGVFDDRPDTQLTIETYTRGEVTFEQAQFLRVLKIAKEIRFVHEKDHARLLFKAENVRGIVAPQHLTKTTPDLS